MDRKKLKEALDILYTASGNANLNRQQHEVVANAARAIMQECGLEEQPNGSQEVLEPEVVKEGKNGK
jgi:hypothetical protein|tara:strand:- start:728 stop:928 length:201 start_codon:yes stop_codon:yes gene_type:complete